MQYLERQVIAIVAAAGGSRRFGSDKRRAPLADGRTLLEATLTLAQHGFAETWVVLREADDAAELGIPDSVRVLRTPTADGGLGDSLAIAFEALEAQSDKTVTAAAVLLGDMPWVSLATCQRLTALADPGHILRPRHQGRAGHPVVFGRDFWPRLSRLSGERGAQEVLGEHTEACRFVEVDDPGIHRDVDRPEDL